MSHTSPPHPMPLSRERRAANDRYNPPVTILAKAQAPTKLVSSIAIALFFVLGLLLITPVSAYAADDFSADEIQTLVAPIALYPDDLLGIMLPASTQPLQIVQATRFLDQAQRDRKIKPEDEWDDSVVALLNYPEAMAFLNNDLDWTTSLGDAFHHQKEGVMDAIQLFRHDAHKAGNLRSDDKQKIIIKGNVLTIKSAHKKKLYVPYYEPEQVVERQNVRVYHYHNHAYPVYYYPYAANHHFRHGPFWGLSTWYGFGWGHHNFYTHYYGHNSHPYYGRNYYGGHYYRPYRPRRIITSHYGLGRHSRASNRHYTNRHGVTNRHGITNRRGINRHRYYGHKQNRRDLNNRGHRRSTHYGQGGNRQYRSNDSQRRTTRSRHYGNSNTGNLRNNSRALIDNSSQRRSNDAQRTERQQRDVRHNQANNRGQSNTGTRAVIQRRQSPSTERQQRRNESASSGRTRYSYSDGGSKRRTQAQAQRRQAPAARSQRAPRQARSAPRSNRQPQVRSGPQRSSSRRYKHY